MRATLGTKARRLPSRTVDPRQFDSGLIIVRKVRAMMARTIAAGTFCVSEQTVNFGFKPRAASRDELTDLWRRVLFAAENGPTCPCHGIVSGRVNPDAIETNMLSPLRTRFRDNGPPELYELIERRLKKSPFAGLRQPFDAWLRGLAEAKIEDGSRKLLVGELQTALKYYAEAQAEFVCE